MRKFEFRAWDSVLNIMVTKENVDDLIKEYEKSKYISSKYEDYQDNEWFPAYDILGIFNYFEAIAENDRFKVMQYTGLKDKNSVKIFEGDILKIGTDKAYVCWEEKYGYFQIRSLPIEEFYFDDDVIGIVLEDMDFEVIGNIYENKELLEE